MSLRQCDRCSPLSGTEKLMLYVSAPCSMAHWTAASIRRALITPAHVALGRDPELVLGAFGSRAADDGCAA